MKMLSGYICFILFICIISGCANVNNTYDYENIITEADTTTSKDVENDKNTEKRTNESEVETTTSYEDYIAHRPYRGGVGIRLAKDDFNTVIFSVDGINVDSQPDYYMGMFLLVNGIPQYFSDENNNTQYISSVYINSPQKTEVKYTCEYNDVPEAEEYVCRLCRMIMPDVIITNQNNFNIGFLQDIGNPNTVKIECEPKDDVDIGVIEGKKIKPEDSKSDVKVLVADAYKGNFLTSTVMERADVVGEYMLEIIPEIDGEYVISFWGNGKPVQVGDYMYYQIDVEKGTNYQYTFELTKELVGSVDNFFALVCPVGEEGYYVTKTRTKIFVDKYRDRR